METIIFSKFESKIHSFILPNVRIVQEILSFVISPDLNYLYFASTRGIYRYKLTKKPEILDELVKFHEDETSKVIKTIDGKEWCVTGDIGYFDEDGFLFLSGRQKNLIIAPDGFKIAPNEIESKICMHEAVSNCIVFGVRDTNFEFGDYPVACVELKNDKASYQEKRRIIQEIKTICEKNLSSYYRPKAYYCGKILYTPMMKDDKDAMRERYNAEKGKSLVKRRNIF